MNSNFLLFTGNPLKNSPQKPIPTLVVLLIQEIHFQIYFVLVEFEKAYTQVNIKLKPAFKT
ncbi:hypothetical protein LEP1GSC133_0721 [Leptospira borgpetersenii serovar Pomona str. 200901868]|uniref:Uncharacterized protein n=1 Tax=Leptospira borgpetersenii serovar Pomona str. 200901868 TaxID=1192866 RepID=M6W1B1_LEPBO|nr:hypothetical protein LEP1GSC133_0721 [Leptospira borgpetersenii serovar Pomona str. 200901868]